MCRAAQVAGGAFAGDSSSIERDCGSRQSWTGLEAALGQPLPSLVRREGPAVRRLAVGAEEADTRTRKSRRTLDLPARCVDALWQHFEDQGWDRLAADEEWEAPGLVFSSAVGKPLDAANVRRAFRQALKDVDGMNADEWTP